MKYVILLDILIWIFEIHRNWSSETMVTVRVTLIHYQCIIYNFSESKMRKLFILLAAVILLLVILDGATSQSSGRGNVARSGSSSNFVKYHECTVRCGKKFRYCMRRCRWFSGLKRSRCLVRCRNRYKACRRCCYKKHYLKQLCTPTIRGTAWVWCYKDIHKKYTYV